jgi:glycosyltransferase involved in cell wall biosynthesis
MLLMGRGSDLFADEVRAAHPYLRGRVHATGGLSSQSLAEHLSTCDLLVQPFEDGVSTKRGSITAALALGVPVATTTGAITESVWTETVAVATAPVDARDDFVSLVDRLAANPAERTALGRRGKRLYAECFAIEHTISALRRRAGAPEAASLLTMPR